MKFNYEYIILVSLI